MLISFTVFCSLCIISVILISYFLFQSTIPMESILRIGRGSVSVSGQAISDKSIVSNSQILSTDSVSQATLFFRDTTQGEQLVAAVTLRVDTTVTLWATARPRFDWTTGSYGIDLQGLSGNLDIFIPKGLRHNVRLTIITDQGGVVSLGESGQYVVSATETQLQIINREGTAFLRASNTNTARSIPVGSQGTLSYTEPPSEVVLSDSYINFLVNSTFEDIYQAGGSNSQSVAQDWACYDVPSVPAGAYQPERKDGRWVMRLVRGEGAESHGETGCLRHFGEERLDVSGYNYLAVRATFEISYQSLNVCGNEASECPLMLRMDYLDVNGQPRIWYHGFYYFLDPQLGFPQQCISCSQEHERVQGKAWYAYDSGNLFNLVSPDQRPSSIVSIRFYASGHQYDTYVGEIALLGS